ncbi:MAG: AraC family transcriptional regulator [Clostridiales bacterium]|nr:AraC family transcriptional regulator [Clostridiales bacterium]
MEEKVFYSYRDDHYYVHHTLTTRPEQETFSFRSHSHNMYEIYFFLDGEADFVVEGNIHALKAGSLMLCTRGATHHIHIKNREMDYERIAILFSQKMMPAGFDQLFQAVGNGSNVFLLSKNERIWLWESFRILEENSGSMQEASIIDALITSILAKLTQMQKNQTEIVPANDPIVRRIIQYIHQNIAVEWHLEDLEKQLFRNRNYLNRRFKAVMGCSIWEYTLRKRIFMAQQQLYITRNITDAFRASGFQDYSVFYRHYKKYIGISPSEELKKFK